MSARIPSALTAVLLAAITAAAGGAPVSAGAPGTTVAAARPAACTIERLPVPEGADGAQVTGGDPSGRYLIGYVLPEHQPETPAVWRDGVLELLDLPFSNGATLSAVSEDGTIVGWGSSSGPARAFVIEPDGTYVQLGSSPSADTLATGVAKDGTVIGVIEEDFENRPVLWRPEHYDTPVELEAPAGTVVPVGIARNRIAASTVLADPERSYVWDAVLDRRPLKARGAGDVTVSALTGRFAAGARYDEETDEFRLLRWRLPSRKATAINVSFMFVEAVNRHGVIAANDGRALLVEGRQVLELPRLEAERPVSVDAVDDFGNAAGAAADATGVWAVTWRCD